MGLASPPSTSTVSTAVPSENSPLISESGKDTTMRDGSGADWDGGSDHWSSTAASDGVPLADSPAQRMERMHRRAASVNEHAWGEHIDGASEQGSVDIDDDSDSDSEGHARKPPVGRWRGVSICLSVWVLLFLQASNMSGMTMTQSTIAEDLDSYASSMWFTTSYLIAASALAPIIGRLATIFPPRTLVPPTAALMALGCLFASWSTTFVQFVLSRVVMGMGAAGVMTLAVVFVLGLVRDERRGLFIGLINVGFTIGLSFGAVVFGAAEPVVGWRALFWIQAPIAAIAGLCLYLTLPPSVGVSAQNSGGSSREKLFRIDYLGAVMLTFTIVLFLYSLAGDIQIMPLVGSGLSLGLFLAVENFYAADPIIPLRVLSSRGMLLSCAAQLGFMSARWTLLFYGPVFMLAVGGYSPAEAGSILIPTNFGFGSGGLIVGWLHIRRGGSFWLPSAASLAAFALTMYILSLVGNPDVSAAVISGAVFLNGLATGAALNYTLAHVLHLSHAGTSFVTTSLLGTVRGFGGSFGTAIGGGVFYRVLKAALEKGYAELDGVGEGGLSEERAALVTKLLGSPAHVFGGGLSDEERAVARMGYAGASRATWTAAAAVGVIIVAVQLGTGWTSPEEEKRRPGRGLADQEARAGLLESEGVGEA